MDRKMFDFSDYRNSVTNSNGNVDAKPQICFDTNPCNPPQTQPTQDVLTMAFVNMQPLDYVYDEEKAFQNGSLFPNITKPFYYGGNYK
ncbi:MAG: spore coat associated protein CotJA [Clostridia bacterium]|nr:spore coat associated protein CotJA [Clostridia bacterium]